MKDNIHLYYTLASLFLISAALFFYQPYFEQKEIMISDDGEISAVVSAADDVATLFEEQDIVLAAGDKVIPSHTAELEEGMILEIKRAAAVTLDTPQGSKIICTRQETVGEFLNEHALSPENSLLVSPPLNYPVYSGIKITVVPYEVTMEKKQEQISYAVDFRDDQTLEEGRRLVLQEGREGVKELIHRIYYHDGEELYRELAAETILAEPENAVVALGTKPRTSLTLASRGNLELPSAEGMASWYGSKFHGRRTSSGELYDQNQFTAAHLTLPFNTLVRVTFLRTGKDVTVRINDRGPHVGGRIIDLSSAAAAEIGLRPHGVGKVRLEVLGKEE